MDLKIRGKNGVVTGADSGIGLATAKLLAEEGVNLVLTDKTGGELERAAEEVRAAGNGDVKVDHFSADLREESEVRELAGYVEKESGAAAILVNCAGIRGAAGDFLTLSDEDWLESIDVDLLCAVRVCRAFLPQMLKNGWGRIVLIASENAFQPYIEESPYNAAKAGIINLSKCLSRAYSPRGVMVNSVSPAFISTPMTDYMMRENAEKFGIGIEEAVQEFLKTDRPNIVVDRRGRPEEVAAVIAFLCSDRASYVTGSNYRVDGGSVGSAFG